MTPGKKRQRPASTTTKTTRTTSKKHTLDPTKVPYPLSSSSSSSSFLSADDEEEESSTSFSEALNSVARLLKSRKRVLVLAGAGISVSCGIPDFRSPQGLYATLDTEELGLSCPEDLFDLEHFLHDPRPFFKFAKALYFPHGTTTPTTTNTDNQQQNQQQQPRPVEPSDSHRFLALLEQQKKLLRVYTQNMDGLEEVAGVSAKRMVYAHGSLQWATCCRCKRKVPSSEIQDAIRNGEVPLCQASLSLPKLLLPPTRRRLERKRGTTSKYKKYNNNNNNNNSNHHSTFTSTSSHSCLGVLKPGVTFFGEILHDNVRKSLEADRDKADALIVIGTSLSVAPMSKVISYLPPTVPRILINRTIVTPPIVSNNDDDDEDDDDDDVDEKEEEFRTNYTFDAYLLGFCDDVTRALVKEMNTLSECSHEGKLLAALDETDPIFSVQDWESARCSIPRDRILLFPGALHTTFHNSNDAAAAAAEEEEDLTYTEIANCDGCQTEIVGTIRKCVQCFDYDLCEACFPILSKTHHNGSHKFAMEPSS